MRKEKTGGRPRLILEEREIEHAIKISRSYGEAARYLNIGYDTFKKWGRFYNLWIEGGINPSGKGIPKRRADGKKAMTMQDIVAGEYNGRSFNATKLKDRLINEAILEEKCDQCDFDEKRIVDERCPLILTFLDDDKKNYKRENLKLLCYNCYFLSVGNIVGRRKKYFYDPTTRKIVKKVEM